MSAELTPGVAPGVGDGAPVSLDLRGRQVVVVGGGPVAARRTRAWLDSGAVVRLVAPWACEELTRLAGDGAVDWVVRDYAGRADLDGAWLVHTSTGDRVTDERVGADCRDLRLWCHDASDAARASAWMPATTSVQTPDGPLTVAVSAHRDPRRATAARDRVAHLLAAGEVPLRRRRPRPGTGWVALVGGGPGDDGLLTTRARTLLAAADVVVVDRLAPRGVLGDLAGDVLVVDVGKTPGHHPVPQDEINALLVEHALAGRGVVRLKGGDPYVLGRGGEERFACEAADVPVEVVPGVTSALAVPAAAGIPVTHRGVARGFTVATGHEDVPDLPTGRDHTVLVLMGVSTLRRNAALMIAAGRDPACPVAVVEDGFGPRQRVTTGTLESIADVAALARVRSPAVVVVGDVVTLSPHWPGTDRSADGHREAEAAGAPV